MLYVIGAGTFERRIAWQCQMTTAITYEPLSLAVSSHWFELSTIDAVWTADHLGHLRPPEGRTNRKILSLINLMVVRFSGTSSVLLVFQAVETPVDRAPYELRLNDHSSGGKSVRVVGSIQSPHAVLPSWPKSNCCSPVHDPF